MNALRSYARCVSNVQRLATANYTGKRCIARWMAPTIRELVIRKKIAGPEPLQLRSNFLEWNQQAELYAFNVRLGEQFDSDLLLRAFTFRSYVLLEEQKQRDVGIQDPKLDIQENTDLIEDGQKITEKIIKVYLCRSLPHAPEECIYALLDYLMSPAIVAKASFHIGTKDLILIADHPVSEETLACTFFALVTALARSPNVDPVRVANFVRDFLVASLAEKELTEIWCLDDPESILNDILVRENREIAEPRLIGQTGVKTLIAAYDVGFYSNKEFLGKGFGETIEEARKTAAIDALNRMFHLRDSCKPIRYDLEIDATRPDVKTENLPLARWCSANVNKIMRQ